MSTRFRKYVLPVGGILLAVLLRDSATAQQTPLSLEPNLVENPSAEGTESDADSGLSLSSVPPAGWGVFRSRGKAECGAAGNAHTGRQCVYLKNLAFDTYGEINNGIVCAESDGGINSSKACEVKPDTCYSFSFYLKGDMAHVEVSCAGWGAGGGAREALWTSLPERIVPTAAWTRHAGLFKTRPTTKRMALMILARGAKDRGMRLGTSFYLDDVSICERDEAVPSQSRVPWKKPATPGTLACYPVGEWFKVYKDGSAHDGQTWHTSTGAVERLTWNGWDGRRIRVSGPRNKYVDFQVILKAAGDVGLLGIETSDLKGPRNAVIPRSQVEAFQEWYVDCLRASAPQLPIEGFDETDDGNRAGVVPVHLPPLSHMLKHYYPDGRLDILRPSSYVPPDLPYQGIWFSVYVPPVDAPAGLYRGTITVRSDAANDTLRIPLELTVEDRCVPLIPYYRAYYPGGDLSYTEDGGMEKGGVSARYAELHLRSRMLSSGYGDSYHVNPTWETDAAGAVRLVRFTEPWQEKYVEFAPVVILDDMFMSKTNGLTGYADKYRNEAAQVYKQLVAYCKERGWWSDDVQRGRYDYSPDGPSYLNVPPGRKPVTVTVQPDEPHTDAEHAVLKAKCDFFSDKVDPDLLVSSTGHRQDKVNAAGIRIAMPHYGDGKPSSGLFYSLYFREPGLNFKPDYIWPYDNTAWVADCASSRMRKLVLGYPELSGSFAGNYAWHCAIAQRDALDDNTPTWRSNMPIGLRHGYYAQHNCTLVYSGHYVGYDAPVRCVNLQYLRNACEVYDLKMLGTPKFSDATDPVRNLVSVIADGRVRLTWQCDAKSNPAIKGFNLWGSRGDQWGAGGRAFAGPYNPVYDCERLNRPDPIPPQASGAYEVAGFPAGAEPQHYILELVDQNNNPRYSHVVVMEKKD